MTSGNTYRVLLTGGGSGGHIYPLLAVADELKIIGQENHIVFDLRYMGPDDRFAEIIKDSVIPIVPIAGAKIRRYASAQNLIDIPLFGVAMLQCFWKMYWLMPDVVFSKGGPGALPVVFWAWFYGIPVIIHESDAQPGLTNLLSARFARRVAVSFESALPFFRSSITTLIGNPIRRTLLEGRVAQDAAKKELGFEPSLPLTLILGGSQGSQRINEFVAVNLPVLIAETQILHQTGPTNFLDVQKLSRAALIDAGTSAGEDNRYKPVAYLEEQMKLALAAADVVVARAGSGTIFEAAAFGRPLILIPLAESANDHQRQNAYAFAESGGGVVIEESNLLPGILTTQLKSILTNPALTQKMSAAATAFAKTDAAGQLAQEIIKIVV